MSANSLVNDLRRSWSGAVNQWSETSSAWRDAKSSRFEQSYWAAIEREMRAFLTEIEQLLAAIEIARSRVRS